MKSKIRTIAFTCVTLVAAYFCLRGTYRVLSWKDTSGSDLSSLTQLYNTEKNLMDVVFVGSSHCYCGIYPPYFWEDKGIAAFDLAVSAQDRISALHHLKELLKTQSPKVVFVDAYGITYASQMVVANEYRNMLSMRPGLNAASLVMEYAEPDKWLDYLFRFPIIHGRYRELGKRDFVPFSPNEFGRGELVNWRIDASGMGAPNVAEAFDPVELDGEQLKWLDDLVMLSEENGFWLVFYSTPFYISDEAQRQMDAVAVYAEERFLPMLDFNRMSDEIGFDYHYDLQDPEHCNASGARKLADFLEAYLEENVTLEDHRGDERYWQWDQDLAWYYHCSSLSELQQRADAADYARTVAGMKDVIAIISVEGEDFLQSDAADYPGALAAFGIDDVRGGKWIWRDGKISKVLENDLNAQPYFLELNNTDTLRISYAGDYTYPENVMVNGESYYNNGHRLAIIVYDCLLDEILHCGYF